MPLHRDICTEMMVTWQHLKIFYNLSMFFYYEKYLSRKMPSPLAYFNTLIENKEKIQKVIVPLNQTVIYQNQSSLII